MRWTITGAGALPARKPGTRRPRPSRFAACATRRSTSSAGTSAWTRTRDSGSSVTVVTTSVMCRTTIQSVYACVAAHGTARPPGRRRDRHRRLRLALAQAFGLTAGAGNPTLCPRRRKTFRARSSAHRRRSSAPTARRWTARTSSTTARSAPTARRSPPSSTSPRSAATTGSSRTPRDRRTRRLPAAALPRGAAAARATAASTPASPRKRCTRTRSGRASRAGRTCPRTSSPTPSAATTTARRRAPAMSPASEVAVPWDAPELAALFTAGREQGCIDESLLERAAEDLDLDTGQLGALSGRLGDEGIEVRDDCGLRNAPPTAVSPAALAVYTTDALQQFLNEAGRHRAAHAGRGDRARQADRARRPGGQGADDHRATCGWSSRSPASTRTSASCACST